MPVYGGSGQNARVSFQYMHTFARVLLPHARTVILTTGYFVRQLSTFEHESERTEIAAK